MDDLIQIFEKYLNKAKYEEHKVSTEECKKCGGQCCKALGCQFSPSDFKKIDYDTLLNFINDTKCISIDWWEGNPFEEDDNIEDSCKSAVDTLSNDFKFTAEDLLADDWVNIDEL